MNFRSGILTYMTALRASTSGAAATTYIVVVGCVAMVAIAAFGRLRNELESAAKAEAMLVATAKGVESDAPNGSLYAEVTAAGIAEVAATPPWSLGASSKQFAAVAAYRSRRGHSSSEYDAKKSGYTQAPLSPDDKSNGPAANGSDKSNPPCQGATCRNKNSCFAAGTSVETPDGPRPIEAIQEGDVVLSADEYTGELSARTVVQAYEREGTVLVALTLVDPVGKRDTLRVTPEHPFFTLGQNWTRAGDLQRGDVVVGLHGELEVVDTEQLPLGETVYNLAVETTHTYFVGTIAALVHNEENLGTLSSNGETLNMTRELIAPNRWEVVVRDSAGKKVGNVKYEVSANSVDVELIESKKSGLGTMLMDQVVKVAEDQGKRQIKVLAATKEADPQAFYKKMGLIPDPDEVRLLKELAPELTDDEIKARVGNMRADTDDVAASLEKEKLNAPVLNKPQWVHAPPQNNGDCTVQ